MREGVEKYCLQMVLQDLLSRNTPVNLRIVLGVVFRTCVWNQTFYLRDPTCKIDTHKPNNWYEQSFKITNQREWIVKKSNSKGDRIRNQDKIGRIKYNLKKLQYSNQEIFQIRSCTTRSVSVLNKY